MVGVVGGATCDVVGVTAVVWLVVAPTPVVVPVLGGAGVPEAVRQAVLAFKVEVRP